MKCSVPSVQLSLLGIADEEEGELREDSRPTIYSTTTVSVWFGLAASSRRNKFLRSSSY